MPLSTEQKRFIHLFVLDGEYELVRSCTALGVRPSVAWGWLRDPEFMAAVREAEGVMLASMGYGPLRVMRDTLAIAHSDITTVQSIGGDMEQLPRNVRVAIKKIKFGVGIGPDGKAVPYPKEVEMHDKAWALKQAAEWYGVADSPEAKAPQATKVENGPKRITGLVVRPPLTPEEKELEDLLK